MDIDELIADSFTSRPSRTCWAKTLEGDSATYLAAIQARIEQGDTPVFRAVSRNLGKLGFSVGPTSVATHLKGECSCHR